MTEKTQKFISFTLGVLAMSILLSYLVFAWTEPSQNPPGGNVAPPLNTSINAQAKEGALVVGNNSAVTTGLIVRYGNVGIGTTGPVAKLVVSSSLNSTPTPDGGIIMSLQNPTLALSNGDTRVLDFGSLNVSTAFIRAVGRNLSILDGNVGIGTTAPSYKLHVVGNVGVTDTIWKAGDWGVWLGGTNNPTNIVRVGEIYGGSGLYAPNTGITLDSGASLPYFKISYASSAKFYIDSAGNVGIGTTAPGAKLHVKSDGTTAIRVDAPSSQQVGYQWAKDGSVKWSAYINASSNDLMFWDGTDNRVTFASGGNVGIGTTAPSYKLDVRGYIYSSGYVIGGTGLCIGSDCRTKWPEGGGLTGSGTTNYLAKWTGSTSLGNSSIYENYGNVGIGTTNPSAKLHVAGGDIHIEGGRTIYSSGRMHIHGGETLYLLNKSGVIVSKAWGGNGNLTVEGALCLGGDCRTSWPGGGGNLSCTQVACSAPKNDTCQASCPSGYTLTGGGIDYISKDEVFWVKSYPSGNSWICGANYCSATCYAICCKIQ